jgi:hypothetical protein
MNPNLENNKNIEIFFNKNNNFIIIKSYNGKILDKGKEAKLNIEKNKYWLVNDLNNNKEFIIVHCNKNYFTFIDIESLEILKKFTTSWYIDLQGYVTTNLSKDSNPIENFEIKNKNNPIHLHAVLLNHFGNGKEKGALSVDHINQDKLDNRLCNLRITTQSVQNSNRPYERNKDSKFYTNKPNGMEHIDRLPRYLEYYTENRKLKDTITIREYFKLVHPKCPAYGKQNVIVSSKSNSVNAIDKYNFILDKMKELDIEIKYC